MELGVVIATMSEEFGYDFVDNFIVIQQFHASAIITNFYIIVAQLSIVAMVKIATITHQPIATVQRTPNA